MKKQLLFTALLTILFSAFSHEITAQTNCPIVKFAVVELFTSQGCSSCPNAETALNTVIAAEKTSGRNVICIAEHVKYWDYIGWTDPYGDAQFQARQSSYSGGSLGTPYVYVNKTAITSYPTSAVITNAINSQLGFSGITPSVGVCLTLQSAVTAPTLTVGYELSGNYTGANLIVCLVEDDRITTPTSGENAGVTLHEDGVSRKFIVTPLTDSVGTVTITPPANCVRSKSRIYAYVQTPSNVFRGATKGIDLAPLYTGVQNIATATGMNVFPNPATDKIYLNYYNPANKGAASISLTDLSGRLVYSENIVNTGNTGEFNKHIDATSFAKGVYILKFTTENETVNKKIVIE